MMDTIAKFVAGFFVVVCTFIVIAGIIAVPVMWMWDYVMPAIFGLPEITFWQSLWGTLMCRLLFAPPSGK